MPQDKWEESLFRPPPWPYEEKETTDYNEIFKENKTSYGYNTSKLDTIPVQNGVSYTLSPNTEMTEAQAKTYYSQFDVFREVILDKDWAARQKCTHHRPETQMHTPADNQGPSHRPSQNQQLYTDHAHNRRRSSTTTACSVDIMNGRAHARSKKSKKDHLNRIYLAIRHPRNRQKHKKSCGSSGASVGKTYTILRIPFLIGVITFILIELSFYVLLRNIVLVYEWMFIWRGRRGALRKELNKATSYREWMECAHELDKHSRLFLDRSVINPRYCDASFLLNVTEALRGTRRRIDEASSSVDDKQVLMETLCDLLRQGALKANAGGWENRQMWNRAYSGTTHIIKEYVSEVVASIQYIRRTDLMLASKKVELFRHIARQQGRTALCLSGGAAMGWKHLGVARCLLDEARLPKVISGTSSGSLVAALLGTHTDEELRKIIRPEFAKYITPCQESSSTNFRRWIDKGHYFDPVEWAPRTQVFTRGDMTFQEAFERTGKILNITCTPMGHKYTPAKVLNYITAPDVLVWTAVLASACIPGILPPMVLLMKTRKGKISPYTGSGVQWRDGSFRTDIPDAELRVMLNVQFTIVSQVNPHIALFFYNRDGSIGQPPARRYSSVWRGGFILSAIEHALKLDIRKWLRLISDLSLIPLLFNQDWSKIWLQKFDGNVTIIPKFAFDEYFSLLEDPSEETLAKKMRAGIESTWPALQLIKSRQLIEDAITDGWSESRVQLEAHSQPTVPSYHYTSVRDAHEPQSSQRNYKKFSTGTSYVQNWRGSNHSVGRNTRRKKQDRRLSLMPYRLRMPSFNGTEMTGSQDGSEPEEVWTGHSSD